MPIYVLFKLLRNIYIFAPIFFSRTVLDQKVWISFSYCNKRFPDHMIASFSAPKQDWISQTIYIPVSGNDVFFRVCIVICRRKIVFKVSIIANAQESWIHKIITAARWSEKINGDVKAVDVSNMEICSLLPIFRIAADSEK